MAHLTGAAEDFGQAGREQPLVTRDPRRGGAASSWMDEACSPGPQARLKCKSGHKDQPRPCPAHGGGGRAGGEGRAASGERGLAEGERHTAQPGQAKSPQAPDRAATALTTAAGVALASRRALPALPRCPAGPLRPRPPGRLARHAGACSSSRRPPAPRAASRKRGSETTTPSGRRGVPLSLRVPARTGREAGLAGSGRVGGVSLSLPVTRTTRSPPARRLRQGRTGPPPDIARGSAARACVRACRRRRARGWAVGCVGRGSRGLSGCPARAGRRREPGSSAGTRRPARSPAAPARPAGAAMGKC